MTLWEEVEARTPTLSATEFIRTADVRISETLLISETIAHVLENWKGTGGIDWVMIDSHRIGEAVHRRRARAGKDTNTLDECTQYVQHLLREAWHVCRHAEGSSYRIHPADVCGDACTYKYDQAKRRTTRPMTTCCFVEATTEGTCPVCE
jgi:hypothetical protein